MMALTMVMVGCIETRMRFCVCCANDFVLIVDAIDVVVYMRRFVVRVPEQQYGVRIVGAEIVHASLARCVWHMRTFFANSPYNYRF